MVISLSPLLYHHRLSDFHAGEIIRHAPSLVCRHCSVSADKLFRLQRSGVLSQSIAQWSALFSIPF